MKAMHPSRLVFVAPLLLAATVALVLLTVATVWATYAPNTSIELSDYNAGENADVTNTFSIPHNDVLFDGAALMHFSGDVTFYPPEWGIAADTDATDGATVGSLALSTTLGVVNGPCVIPISTPFTLVDATADTSTEFSDTGDMYGGTWNGYDPACPGGKERAICQWPSFLSEVFPGLTPLARYYGHVFIAPLNTHFIANVLVFEPGTSLYGQSFPADWGYGSATVIQDPTLPGTSTGAVNDLCSPLTSVYTLYGTAAGTPLRTNPPYGGTYTFRSWSRGARDNDNDSYENGIDTCPFVTNLDGNIRDTSVLNPDQDGIDSACDTDPTGICGPGVDDDANPTDCDLDIYLNRGDNCPFTNNDSQDDTDEDGMGDACDPAPTIPFGNTSRPEVTEEMNVDIAGPSPVAVGGIAELPEVPGSSERNYTALGGLAAATLLTLTLGAWYARRRWAR